MRLIIFEDELIIAKSLKQLILEKTSVNEVVIVNNFEKFKNEIQNSKYDIALLDVNINNEPLGIKAGALLRENYQVGIVYLTANTDDESIDEIIKAKPDAYLIKPFEDAQLIATVKQVIAKYSSNNILGNISVWKNTNGITQSKIQFFQETLDNIFLISVTDQKGKIIYANHEFCKISGFTQDELIGHHHNIVNSGLHPKEFFAGLWKKIQNGEMWQGEIRNKRKDGSHYWVHSYILPLSAEDNDKTQYFISIRNDITEQINLREKIQKQFEDQSNLTRVISHDINNYLSVIKSGIQIIDEHAKTEKLPEDSLIVRIIKRMSTSVLRITALIKNVRELQSIEDSKYKATLSSINLLDSIRESLDIFSERISQKSITIEVNCSNKHYILADKNSLSMSVINNVLSNSIKFSELNGKIKFSVEDAVEYIKLTIEDNGIGMSPDLLNNIFSKNIKTTRPGTQNETGTGFGMPLVKKYIESYGGSISIESKSIETDPKGSGTKITICFINALNKKNSAA